MSKKRPSSAKPSLEPDSAETVFQTGATPIQLLEEALDEHFAENEVHFCRSECAEDLLKRMNKRGLYIIGSMTLDNLHASFLSTVQWYEDALETIRDNLSPLRPEVIAKIALEHRKRG